MLTRSDANRRYCTRRCSRLSNRENIAAWVAAHPGCSERYNRTRLQKKPTAYIDQRRKDRAETIALLGGACVVCGETYWPFLEIDYIPTTRGKPHRHSRGHKFMRDNAKDFRVLCANHHRELSTTGRIAGTEIVQ